MTSWEAALDTLPSCSRHHTGVNVIIGTTDAGRLKYQYCPAMAILTLVRTDLGLACRFNASPAILRGCTVVGLAKSLDVPRH